MSIHQDTISFVSLLRAAKDCRDPEATRLLVRAAGRIGERLSRNGAAATSVRRILASDAEFLAAIASGLVPLKLPPGVYEMLVKPFALDLIAMPMGTYQPSAQQHEEPSRPHFDAARGAFVFPMVTPSEMRRELAARDAKRAGR